jgi:hypothetical protein
MQLRGYEQESYSYDDETFPGGQNWKYFVTSFLDENIDFFNEVLLAQFNHPEPVIKKTHFKTRQEID